jgi:hypothetical protein
METVDQLMESVARGLITVEEMKERLALATAKWRTAQAEIERLREENLRLRNDLAMREGPGVRARSEDDENNAKEQG